MVDHSSHHHSAVSRSALSEHGRHRNRKFDSFLIIVLLQLSGLRYVTRANPARCIAQWPPLFGRSSSKENRGRCHPPPHNQARGGAAIIKATNAPSTVTGPKGRKAQNAVIVSHVRHILNERLAQVLSGRRAKDVRRFYGKKSMIESTSSLVSLDTESSLLDDETFIFPKDKSSLDITTIPSPHFTHKQSDDNRQLSKISTVGTCVRVMHLGVIFAPVLSTLWLALLSRRFRNGPWYSMVAHSLSKSGAVFYSWGQWAATRPDMFSDALCAALHRQQHFASRHSWSYTKRQVERALALPKKCLFQVLESMDSKPISCNAIAQVHRAILRPSHNLGKGTMIAVKVRHAHLSKSSIQRDIRIMTRITKFVFSDQSWQSSIISQFHHELLAQTRLDVEARHWEVLGSQFLNRWNHVCYPRPIFATSNVVLGSLENAGEPVGFILDSLMTDVMEAEDKKGKRGDVGDKSTSLLEHVTTEKGVAKDGELMPTSLTKFVVTTIVSVYLSMLFQLGVNNSSHFMHADLHPDNVLIDCEFYNSRNVRSNVKFTGVAAKRNTHFAKASKGVAFTKQFRSSATAGTRRRIVKDSSGELRGYFTLLDKHGRIAVILNDYSTNFIALLMAMGKGDGRAAGYIILHLLDSKTADIDSFGFGNKSSVSQDEDDKYIGRSLTEEDRELFVEEMTDLFEHECKGYGTNVNLGLVLRNILGLIKKYRMRLDANYVALFVNTLYMDSISRRACPSYNLLDASKPMLLAYPRLRQCREGNLVICRPSKIRRAIIRIVIPLLYRRKNRLDNRFFRRLDVRRRAGARDGKPLKRLSLLITNTITWSALAVVVYSLAQDKNIGGGDVGSYVSKQYDVFGSTLKSQMDEARSHVTARIRPVVRNLQTHIDAELGPLVKKLKGILAKVDVTVEDASKRKVVGD